MKLVVHSTEELVALKRRAGRRGITRIVLNLPGDDAVMREREKEINRRLRVCGCKMGALFVAAAIVFVTLRFVLIGIRPAIVETIVLLFAAALLGKICGLAFEEYQLRNAINRLV